eukprot:COSAG04_NODE_848_length_9881_cov_5.280822_6_plen_88_part_00
MTRWAQGAGETQLALTSKGTLLTIGHGDRQLERYQMFSESADGVSWGPVRRAASLVNIVSRHDIAAIWVAFLSNASDVVVDRGRSKR